MLDIFCEPIYSAFVGFVDFVALSGFVRAFRVFRGAF
jgi:hypothetical protein